MRTSLMIGILLGMAMATMLLGAPRRLLRYQRIVAAFTSTKKEGPGHSLVGPMEQPQKGL